MTSSKVIVLDLTTFFQDEAEEQATIWDELWVSYKTIPRTLLPGLAIWDFEFWTYLCLHVWMGLFRTFSGPLLTFLGLIVEVLVKSWKLNYYCSNNFTMGEQEHENTPKILSLSQHCKCKQNFHNQILNSGSHRKACNIHTKFHLTSNAFLACFLHKVLKTDQPNLTWICLAPLIYLYLLWCIYCSMDYVEREHKYKFTWQCIKL